MCGVRAPGLRGDRVGRLVCRCLDLEVDLGCRVLYLEELDEPC